MATGTGLPVLKSGDVRTAVQPVLDGDKFSSAADWTRIAAVGENIAKMGADELKKSEHQAQVGYLADQETDIARNRAILRDQHANNPEGFDAAWKGYSEGKLSEAQPWAINQIKKTLGSEGNAAFSAILGERRQKTETNAKASWNALEELSSNDVTGSAMAGTLMTPDGVAKIEKHRAVIETGVTSGFIPPAEAERRIANLESQATVYAARTDIKGAFDRDGPSGALARIDAVTRDEKLSLSPEQRFALSSRLRADVHAWNADREQKVSEVDLEAKALTAARQGGVPIAQARIDQTVERYKALGGHAQAAAFLADQQHAADVSWYARAPLRDAASDVESRAVRAGLYTPKGTPEQASAVTSVASRLGVSPRDLSAAISYETGGTFNPSKVGGKGNNYMGLIQFGPEERAKYGVRPGMTFEEQMVAVEGFLRDRGVKPGMGISEIYRTINGGNPNASLNASDGNGTIAEHIQRIERNHYGNADRFLGGTAPATAPSDITYIGKANATVSKRVTEEANAVIEGMNRKDNPVLPTSEKMDELLTAAAATNMPDVLTKVSQAAGEWQFRRQFGRAPLPDEAAAVNDLQRRASTTGLDANETRQYEIARETYDATRKALDDDPLGHTIKAASETASLPAPKPLDFKNPVALQDGLKLRGAWAEYGARTYQMQAMPALTAAEQQQVRGALDAADPAGKARIYGSLVNNLPPATRAATLAALGKDNMVEAFAGGMIGADARVAESIMRGQAAMKVKDTYDPTKGSTKDDVAAALDKALPAGAFSVSARTNPNGAYATIRSAAIARAADIAASDPNFKEFTPQMIERAVTDVTGGVLTHNGSSLIAPIRGMPQAEFDKRIWSITDADLAGVQTKGGQPITAEYLRNNAQLESRSDGTYLVRLGQDFERPIYAFRDNGNLGAPGGGPRMSPFVLDMRNIKPTAQMPTAFGMQRDPYLPAAAGPTGLGR